MKQQTYKGGTKRKLFENLPYFFYARKHITDKYVSVPKYSRYLLESHKVNVGVS